MAKAVANEFWRLWAKNVFADVRNKSGRKDDVELLMSYFCEIFSSTGDVPIEMLEWINHAFSEYLHRKHINGALEAAFGLTKKQGYRKLEKRNEDIAYDVARYYLYGYKIGLSISKVSFERNLSVKTIEDAWRGNCINAFTRIRLKLDSQGKDLTQKQYARGLKVIERSLQKTKTKLENLENPKK